MSTIDYLLIGHVTADLIRGGRVLGGTVSYSAPIVRAFNHRVGMLTSAAASEPLIEPLRQYADVAIRMAGATTTFENIYRDGSRTQYVHSLAEFLPYSAIPNGWLDTPLVHLAPLVNEVDPAIASHFPDATVLLTPQGYMRQWGADGKVNFKHWLDQDMLRHVDILVCSRQDIADAPELEYKFGDYVDHVIVTNGDRGGMYYHDGQAEHYEAYPVTEIDPTGAGDVFAAALLSSMLHFKRDLRAALKVAARLAAISVTRVGAPDFTDQDIQSALEAARVNE
jgi:sugar/nucleoside kinase (ribokinase family)